MSTDTAKPKRPAGKRTEPPLSAAEQRRRFEELSRELGTDGGEQLDKVFGRIVPPKTRPTTKPQFEVRDRPA